MENDIRKILLIEGLNKSYEINGEQRRVIRNFNLDVNEGEFVCILGYSGCGKTTLLRMLAGLEHPDAGRILLNGKVKTKPEKDIVLVFQDFNQLFPWKTVRDNIVHPLMATGTARNKKEAQMIADNILSEVDLSDFSKSYPNQLSGGMKQRVAVARALVLNPKVMLMDEPFAALDAVTRRNLQKMIKEICKKHKETILFVTHSVEEAVLLADRIIVLNNNPKEECSIARSIDNERYSYGDQYLRTMLVNELIDSIGGKD